MGQSPKRDFPFRGTSFPACAGEPEYSGLLIVPERVYPRVGEGTETVTLSVHCDHGLSPRGRGNQLVRAIHNLGRRSIPAWAGEPPR